MSTSIDWLHVYGIKHLLQTNGIVKQHCTLGYKYTELQLESLFSRGASF